jgi:hypothetical protein
MSLRGQFLTPIAWNFLDQIIARAPAAVDCGAAQCIAAMKVYTVRNAR